MNSIPFLCALLCAFCCHVFSDEEGGKHWALLVAGSNTYMNYRHQADICHAYQIVRKHGIPDERIVVMMYDDIAFNSYNPLPGKIINRPDGPDVYKGVLKDYTKEEVTPEVFLKVLTGDEVGVEKLLGRPGKVIKSGPNDFVFVNFADHGASGLIAFPNDVLHAKELNDAINSMHKNKQYNKMVIYVEACESGSMFNNDLKDNINVFVTTAANPYQSSYACYYDARMGTFLGDLYSVNWMEDSDKENLAMETLQTQYKIVKQKTNLSEVMEYGDLSLKNYKVGDFQGNLSDYSIRLDSERKVRPQADSVRSEDVELTILTRRAEYATGIEKLKLVAKIQDVLKRKQETVNFFKNIVQFKSNIAYEEIIHTKINFSDYTCYRKSVDMIIELCPGLKLSQNDYALRNLRSIANLCERKEVSKEQVWSSIKHVIVASSLCEMK